MVELDEAIWNIDYDGEDFTVPVGNFGLLGQMWKPSGDPKFIYVFVHGLDVFTTFKKDFFHVILDMQGVVFGCDHKGHGRSPGPRISTTIDEIVEETFQVVKHAKDLYPDLPVILHGHSMGGLTVLTLAMKRPEFVTTYIEGMIAEAPWISSCPQRRVGCCTLCGAKMIRGCAPNAQLNGGVSHFSPDLHPKWVELVSKSPLFGQTVTPRLFCSVQDTIKFVRENQQAWPNDLHLLFVQGKKDDLVDAEESDVWIRSMMSNDKRHIIYKQYPEGPHVMLKTKIRGEVVREFLSFIESRIPGVKYNGPSGSDGNNSAEEVHDQTPQNEENNEGPKNEDAPENEENEE